MDLVKVKGASSVKSQPVFVPGNSDLIGAIDTGTSFRRYKQPRWTLSSDLGTDEQSQGVTSSPALSLESK